MRAVILTLVVSPLVLMTPLRESMAASACVATVQVAPVVVSAHGAIPAGHVMTVQITANVWPQPTTAYVWFGSPDARWKGAASWQSDCRCFVITHQLPIELHPLEPAVLTVRLHSATGRPTCTFFGAHDALYSVKIRHLSVLGNVPLVTPVPGEGGTSDYTARWGDTLSSIAAEHGLTLMHVEALNPQIHDPNRIFVGEVIHLH